jgi:hypothetical protein
MKSTLLKTFVTIALTVVISLTAKGQDKKILKLQKEIDSLAKAPNDKIYYRLKKSQSIKYYNGVLLAYVDLVYKNSYESKKDSTIYYCNKFEEFEKLHPDKLLRVKYLMYKGQDLYIHWGLDEEALKCQIEAYELIKSIKGELILKNHIIRHIAILYNHKKEHDKALKLLLEQMKDTSVLSYNAKRLYLLEIVNTYQDKKLYAKSNQFNDILLKLALKNKDQEWYLRSKIEFSENYIRTGNPNRAIDSCKVLQKKLLKDNSPQFRDIKQNNIEYLALAYQEVGDYKNAILYLKEIIGDSKDISDSGTYLYDYLIACYEKENNLKEVINTYKEKSKCIDIA